MEVVTGDFPTCWEMEVMDNGSAEDDEGENEDVYARYVKVVMFCRVRVLTRSLYQYTAAALRDGLGLQGRLRRSAGTFIRIRDCPPFLRKRLGHDTAFTDKRREQHEHVLATARAAARAGREEPTHLEHRDRPARRGDELDNDHDRDDDDDENGNADHDGRRGMRCRTGVIYLCRL